MKTMLPTVSGCAVQACAYNAEGGCRARAITVGDGVHPRCDTFLRSTEHCPTHLPLAGVGACKVTACEHNREYECEAAAIRMGAHDAHADCLTFRRAP